MGKISLKTGISIIVAYGFVMAAACVCIVHANRKALVNDEPGQEISGEYDAAMPEHVDYDADYDMADSYGDIAFGDWKEMYLDYIANFDRAIADTSMDEKRAETLISEIRFGLVYVDDDDIPELYIEYPEYPWYKKARIITCRAGKLNDISGERSENGVSSWSYCEYIERSGLFLGVYDEKSGYKRIGAYMLEGGEVRILGSGIVSPAYGKKGDTYTWNGAGLTKEEFDGAINDVYDRTKSLRCDEMTSLYEIKDLIEGY